MVDVDARAGSATCHADLIAGGVYLPLQHRALWLANRSQESWFIRVMDAGVCSAGFALEASKSRVLPGFRTIRTRRFGAMADGASRRRGLEAAVALARHEPRILRYHIELFAADAIDLRAIAEDLRALGFQRSQHPLCYQETIAIDLRRTEEELLASFHATGRRHIRAADKKPVDVVPLDDPVYGPRIEDLLRETLARTGGHYAHQDWATQIALARDHPDLARIVGMFRSGHREPDALWAFAMGHNHGDHVEYGVAASTRDTGGVRLPMGYALAWDLMRWAKRSGATWFDFGGITRGTQTDASDPLGGISDFKRYFSTNVVAVGDEWVFVVHPIFATIATTLGTLARRLFGKSSSARA